MILERFSTGFQEGFLRQKTQQLCNIYDNDIVENGGFPKGNTDVFKVPQLEDANDFAYKTMRNSIWFGQSISTRIPPGSGGVLEVQNHVFDHFVADKSEESMKK